MRVHHIAAAIGTALSGALLTASCARSQDPFDVPDVGIGIWNQQTEMDDWLTLTSTEDGSTGEAPQPWLGLALAFTCEFALHVAGKRRCEDDAFWQTQCPAGQRRVIHDVWKGSNKSAAISCDKARELTCDLEGGLVGFAAYHLVCSLFL